MQHSIYLHPPVSPDIANLVGFKFCNRGANDKAFNAFAREPMAKPQQGTTKSIAFNALCKPFDGALFSVSLVFRVKDAPSIRGGISRDCGCKNKDGKLWPKINCRLFEAIRDALEHLLRFRNNAICKVSGALAAGLQLVQPKRSLSSDDLRPLINVNGIIFGESSRLKRDWSGGTCMYYSPLNGDAAIFGHRLLNSLKDVEIVANLVK